MSRNKPKKPSRAGLIFDSLLNRTVLRDVRRVNNQVG
jgi:hypothetical protein